jgi:hypothetical protein
MRPRARWKTKLIKASVWVFLIVFAVSVVGAVAVMRTASQR